MDTPRTPTCIGIILDGNRRWAKARGLPSVEGHWQGAVTTETIVLAARDRGVVHVVIYAFSTENWHRSPEEVSAIVLLFEIAIRENFSRLASEGVAVRFVGQRERFSSEMQQLLRQVEVNNPAQPRLTLWVCLSYSGRADIVQAAQFAAKSGEEITEEVLAKYLWTADQPDTTAGMPDPDLIIRTGGEKRLSNFLLWQAAYSELFFIDTPWPAFTVADLDAVLAEYARRERRMGV